MNMESVCPGHKMVKPFVIIVLVLLSLFLAAKTYQSLKESKEIGKPVPYEYSISVEGVGEATAVPDLAKFTYSIETKAASTAESQNKNAELGNAMIERLVKEGVAKADIKTTSYNSYQNYTYDANGNATPSDWTTSQSVELSLRDLTKASSLLSVLGELGATNIYGPNMQVENQEKAKDEARVLAIANVKAKAQQIADSFDLEIKSVSGYSEWTDAPYYPYGMGGSMMAAESMMKTTASPTIEPGEAKVTLHVTATYTLKSSNK